MIRSAVVAALVACACAHTIQDDVMKLVDMASSMQNSGSAYIGATGHLSEMMDSTTALIQSAQVALNQINAENAALQKSADDMQKAFADNDYKAGIAKMKSDSDAEIAKVSKAASDLTTSVQNTITSEVSTTVAAVDKTIKDFTDSVKSITASKMGVGRHLFSGRSRTWGDRGGWRDYVINQVECDTARPMFYLRTQTRFRTLEAGVYHILWWAIQHGGRCHAHSRVRFDSGAWLHEHNHNYLTDGAWEGNYLEMNWKFNKNKDFWTTHSNGCGQRWHISPGNINDGNSYTRIFVEYIGQVLDDKGNQVKWNGPQ